MAWAKILDTHSESSVRVSPGSLLAGNRNNKAHCTGLRTNVHKATDMVSKTVSIQKNCMLVEWLKQ
jgi:hypothetical protein